MIPFLVVMHDELAQRMQQPPLAEDDHAVRRRTEPATEPMEAVVVMEAVVMKARVMMEASAEPAAMEAPTKSAVDRTSVRPTGGSWSGQRERQHDDEREAHCPADHGAPPDIEVPEV